jgi:hypothetical protein
MINGKKVEREQKERRPSSYEKICQPGSPLAFCIPVVTNTTIRVE